MMENSKHIELAKKLKALADKGVGGEKINAAKMLSDLLKKHNLTIEDIEGEKTEDYFFKLKKEDVKLWAQIIGKVNYKLKCYGEFPASKVKKFKMKGNYMTTCTAAEYVEIESMLAVYKRLFQEEMGVFFRAFCQANNLLVSNWENKSTSELTAKEREEYMRANAMADKIKTETFRKQLSA